MVQQSATGRIVVPRTMVRRQERKTECKLVPSAGKVARDSLERTQILPELGRHLRSTKEPDMGSASRNDSFCQTKEMTDLQMKVSKFERRRDIGRNLHMSVHRS